MFIKTFHSCLCRKLVIKICIDVSNMCFGLTSVINIIQHLLSFITKYDVLTNTCVTLKYNIYVLQMNVSHYSNNFPKSYPTLIVSVKTSDYKHICIWCRLCQHIFNALYLACNENIRNYETLIKAYQTVTFMYEYELFLTSLNYFLILLIP